MRFFSTWLKIGSLVSTLLVVLALACGGGGGRSPEGHLEVINGGTSNMTGLYVTPSSSSSWGVDQLAPNELFPGESLTLSRIDPGYYDVEAFYLDGSIDRVFDVLVQDGVTTILTSLNSGNGSVVVVNNTPLTISGVYLTPTTSSTWGPNQTGGASILSGGSLTLDGVSTGTYALRVYFSNGQYQDATTDITVTSGSVNTIQFN